MKIISANEARALVESSRKKLRVERELKKVNNAIKKEAKKGNNSFWCVYSGKLYCLEDIHQLANVLHETYKYNVTVKSTLSEYLRLVVTW